MGWCPVQRQVDRGQSQGLAAFRPSRSLASLLDPSVAFTGVPALPIGHPFTLASVFYWSATSDSERSDLAWGVIINNASPVTTNKPGLFFRWCVRGGQLRVSMCGEPAMEQVAPWFSASVCCLPPASCCSG